MERELPLAIVGTPIANAPHGDDVIQPLVDVEKEAILAALKKRAATKQKPPVSWASRAKRRWQSSAVSRFACGQLRDNRYLYG